MKKVIAMLMVLCLLMLCLTGCQSKPVAENNASAAQEQRAALDAYLASVKAQSDAIKASLEKDPLTQTDMNQKSQELRELWDGALKHLLEESKRVLSAAEMEKLTAEQNAWLEATEKSLEAAGKEFEGGSMHALAVNSEAAALTEARVYVLYEMLK